MKNKTSDKPNLIYEIIGWYGTVVIILAYALNSFNLLSTANPWYQILNATGSIGIIVISLKKKVYQSVALNVIWTIIASIGLVQIFVTK